MKSAEEIFCKSMEWESFEDCPTMILSSDIIAAMEEYAAQFKQSPSPSVEQEAEAWANANSAGIRYSGDEVYSLLKAAYIAGHNSKAIGEDGWVKAALERISNLMKSDLDIGENWYDRLSEAVSIAKEALKPTPPKQ